MQHDFLNAALAGDVKQMRELVEKGADPNYFASRYGKKELAVEYAITRDNPTMLKNLIEVGANKKVQHEYFENLMQIAIDSRSPEVVPVLLEMGEDPNQLFEDTYTPLTAVLTYDPEDEYASVPDRIVAARALIQAGADVNKDVGDRTPVDAVMEDPALYDLIPDLADAGVSEEDLLKRVRDPELREQVMRYLAGRKRTPLLALRKERKEQRYAAQEQKAGRRKTRRRRTTRRRKTQK